MKESQYTNEYLAYNATLGAGKGISISTFLNATLTGTAKRYGGGYARALCRSCEARVAAGKATRADSKMGAVAYYPKL